MTLFLISEDKKYLEAFLKKIDALSMDICNMNINRRRTKVMKCTQDGDQTSNVWLDS